MRRTIYLYICLIAVGHLFGACGLYSRYEPRPVGFDTRLVAAGDSSSTPLSVLSWRELFTDPSLRMWIDSGLNANTDLRIAKLKVDEAAATLTASRLAMLPSVSISVDGSVSNNSTDRFTVGPTASWEVDIFGRQRNLRMGAEASLQASEAYRQAVQTALIASIADCYYTLLMLDEQLAISERTLKTWDENIRVLQALKRAGRSNEAAVLQARANRLKVENSTISLRQRISEQENTVRSILLDPSASLRRGTLQEQEMPDTLLSGISLEVLSNRPDVRQAEFELQKTFYNINVARAAFYPSLKLSGNLGWTTASGTPAADPSSFIASALGSVLAPVFNRGTNMANLKIARAEHEIAFLNFQQKLLDAGMEVNNALTAWQSARKRLVIDRKQIVALKGAVHNTRLLMRHSPTNYLEVLTAQQRLLEAELAEASDRYEAIQSIIALYHTSGGGIR